MTKDEIKVLKQRILLEACAMQSAWTVYKKLQAKCMSCPTYNLNKYSDRRNQSSDRLVMARDNLERLTKQLRRAELKYKNWKETRNKLEAAVRNV